MSSFLTDITSQMQTHDLQSLVKRLRKEREERGLTLNKLAEIVHLPAARIQYIENRKVKPSETELFLIAGALGVSTEILSHGRSTAKVSKEMIKGAWDARPKNLMGFSKK